MCTRVKTNRNRQGAVLVEMAFVVVVFLMLLFGILEYCRFLFLKQLVTNASREGARFAVVNTTESTVESETLAYVNKKMGGIQANLKNYSAKIYHADKLGNYQGPAQNAEFGEYVAVEVSCDFDPVLPSFLFMNKTLKVQAKSLMCSEAN